MRTINSTRLSASATELAYGDYDEAKRNAEQVAAINGSSNELRNRGPQGMSGGPAA
ncbi:MAG: hypothetical protein KGQ41_08220 [Alphaproteobacteria bacterium]|nr:hypothetical protein [Alphaproteobacteria bacterium]